jgi:hypothetical protein
VKRRVKIPPEDHGWASLASDVVEPSAAIWRVLGATEAGTKEGKSQPVFSRGGHNPNERGWA